LNTSFPFGELPTIDYTDLPSLLLKGINRHVDEIESAKQDFSMIQTLSKKMEEAAARKLERHTRQVNSKAPFPPHLNQAFTANWVLNASVQLTPPFTTYQLQGNLAFDFTTSGLLLALTSITGNIPIDLAFEWRLYPSMNGVEWLQVSPDGVNCYSYIFLQWLWTFFIAPFEIPYDSISLPPVIINGDLCNVWQTTYQWYGQYASTLYVRVSDNTLVQATVPEPFLGFGMADITLTNIQMGANPNSYSRPSTCVSTMKWNSNWDSHLPWYWCDPWC